MARENWLTRRWQLGIATSAAAIATSSTLHMPRLTSNEVEQIATDSTVDAAVNLNHEFSKQQRDTLVTLAAGGISGAFSKTCLAPLARLTILYQVSALSPASSKPGCSTNTPGMLAALRTIVRQEGVTALWRGNFATIVHRIPYSAVNFTTFEMSKKYLEPHVSNDVLRRLVSGAAAGLVACTAAYPLDLVRTRLAAQRGHVPSALGSALHRHAPGSAASAAAAALAAPSTTIAAALPAPQVGDARGAAKATAAAAATWVGSSLHQAQPSPPQSAPVSQPLPQPTSKPSHHHPTSATSLDSSSKPPPRQLLPARPGPRPVAYRGLSHALQTIVHEEGARGLYRGLGATLLQVTPALALNFTLYDSFKDIAMMASTPTPRTTTATTTASQGRGVGGAGSGAVSGQLGGVQGGSKAAGPSPAGEVGSLGQGQGQQLGTVGSLICAAMAGLVTSTITFPLDVVRRRLQVVRGVPSGPTSSYTGGGCGGAGGAPTTYLGVVRHILGSSGWRGFYVGILPEYAKVLPGMAIAFATYEAIKSAGGVGK